jgi:hypothetical protein
VSLRDLSPDGRKGFVRLVVCYQKRVTTDSKPTFRDFVGSLMGSDHDAAARTLQSLLTLDGPAARVATEHFVSKMEADPSFMMKAMGMRTAVESKNVGDVQTLLEACFALAPEQAATSATSLLAQYA